jgi:hypothetical protein
MGDAIRQLLQIFVAIQINAPRNVLSWGVKKTRIVALLTVLIKIVAQMVVAARVAHALQDTTVIQMVIVHVILNVQANAAVLMVAVEPVQIIVSQVRFV